MDSQQFGNTALHIAADQAQREIVELLVNEGMNLDKLNKVNTSKTIFFYAGNPLFLLGWRNTPSHGLKEGTYPCSSNAGQVWSQIEYKEQGTGSRGLHINIYGYYIALTLSLCRLMTRPMVRLT